MSSSTRQTIAEDLRAANARLKCCLECLSVDQNSPEHNRGAISPDEIAVLLAELMRVGEWLRAIPANRSAAVEAEMEVYRRHVERLRDLMPAIHRTLLEERSRLERERARLNSSFEWAQLSRQTL